jgi:Dynamin GTPase effector domain
MSADSAEKIESLIIREQDPFTAQDILLEVLNGIRFRAFDKILLDILDTAASRPPPSSGAKNNQVSSSELSAGLREEVRRKLGSWYIQRHGVDAHGNVQEMATLIQAYWDVASRRLVDNVCMCVEMEFTNKVVRELEAQCFLHSVSMDKSAVERALKEDTLTRDRREQLLMKKDRLLAGIAALKKTAPDVVSRPPDVPPPAPRNSSDSAVKK